MKRRFLQFSLRGLLGLAALVCLLLGGWHLVKSFGQFVRVRQVGNHLVAHGRFIRILGKPTHSCMIEMTETYNGKTSFLGTGAQANRHGLIFYDIEMNIGPCFDGRVYDIALAQYRADGGLEVVAETTITVGH